MKSDAHAHNKDNAMTAFLRNLWQFPFLRKLLLRHIRPPHHVADEIFHIHHRRDKVSSVYQRFIQYGHGKERADAARNQYKTITALPLLRKKAKNSSLASHGVWER